MLRTGILETLRIRVQPVAIYVVYCVVLYNMYLNTSPLSSVKVFCGRCHHVQLACHCAVTGKWS